MSEYTPPEGKTWADLQPQGSGTCQLCGIAIWGWEPQPDRQFCGYCEARRRYDIEQHEN